MIEINWGLCEGCGKDGFIVVPATHRPTGSIVWLCKVCAKSAEEALEIGQVPGLLAQRRQDFVLERVK